MSLHSGHCILESKPRKLQAEQLGETVRITVSLNSSPVKGPRVLEISKWTSSQSYGTSCAQFAEWTPPETYTRIPVARSLQECRPFTELWLNSFAFEDSWERS